MGAWEAAANREGGILLPSSFLYSFLGSRAMFCINHSSENHSRFEDLNSGVWGILRALEGCGGGKERTLEDCGEP